MYITVVVDVCGRFAVTAAIRTRSGPPSTSASRYASSVAAFTGRLLLLDILGHHSPRQIDLRPRFWDLQADSHQCVRSTFFMVFISCGSVSNPSFPTNANPNSTFHFHADACPNPDPALLIKVMRICDHWSTEY
jgi:hypothetical protein